MNSVTIYVIEPTIEHDNGEVYYGSTKKTLAHRFSRHKGSFIYGKFVCTSKVLFDKYGFDNLKITELEKCSQENQKERERYYIETFPCVNRCVTGRTKAEYYQEHAAELAEYQKKYNQKNRVEVQKKRKIYYQEHAAELAEKYAEKYECECGGKYTHCNKSKHIKTDKHQKYISSILCT